MGVLHTLANARRADLHHMVQAACSLAQRTSGNRSAAHALISPFLPQARTVLIICCSPSLFNDAETLSSLRFGVRAKVRCVCTEPSLIGAVVHLGCVLLRAMQAMASLSKAWLQPSHTSSFLL